MSLFIDAEALLVLLQQSTPLILDCRYDLADRESGRRRYLQGHLPGSIHVSLDDDCCAAIGEHGGRHPLPAIPEMAALFGRLGIERGVTDVICLDDEGGCYAAHVWWMLRYLGHEKARVLDGGFTSWLRAGGEAKLTLPEARSVVFTPSPRHEMLAGRQEVRNGEAMLLIDCRAEERYRGEHETIDPVAGHIPGAINMPWRELVASDGRFKNIGALADLLTGVDERAVMYCGSGVTACVNVLAAAEADLGLPRLYAGGWSDWITWPEHPVAR
jgi:thiosulfate/3-mercaptopyruvate sulfurtransferase